MAHRLDPRSHAGFDEILGQMPQFKVTPLVGPSDLRELRILMPHLENLQYPVDSAAELVEQLGGSDTAFEIYGVRVEPIRMIKYMPAYYFPVASIENLVEKMAELVRANRKVVDLPTEIANLREQTPELQFPIEDRDQLLAQIGGERMVRFQGVAYPAKDVVGRVPDRAFPVQSREHFEQITGELMIHRPLIAGHDGQTEWDE
jgi:hypothetical protein